MDITRGARVKFATIMIIYILTIPPRNPRRYRYYVYNCLSLFFDRSWTVKLPTWGIVRFKARRARAPACHYTPFSVPRPRGQITERRVNRHPYVHLRGARANIISKRSSEKSPLVLNFFENFTGSVQYLCEWLSEISSFLDSYSGSCDKTSYISIMWKAHIPYIILPFYPISR